MLEMQAVIGRIQLRRMADWTRQRQANAARLSQALLPFAGEGGAVRLPAFGCASCPGQCGAAGCEHAQYKFYAYVRPENLAMGWSRDRIIEAINAEGVPCYQGSCSEVYLEKAFDDTGWRPQDRLPAAKALGETSIMFLVHPTLTDTELTKTCEVIKTVMTEASNAS
jgi:dTDP-4-amino-4,6-dideoxygalactose transaminase